MASNRRLDYLDSLRGIAAMSVVFSHFIELTPLQVYLDWLYFSPGQFGVAVFFAISGMVIPFSLKEEPNAVAKFALSRFFRLYPAYWASLLLAIVSASLFLHRDIDATQVMANISMLQGFFGIPHMFGVYWTLMLEMVFYVSMAGLFVVGLLRLRHTYFVCALLPLALLFAQGAGGVFFGKSWLIPMSYLLSLSVMFFGSMWRDISLNGWGSKNRLPCLAWLALFLLIIGLMLFMVSGGRGRSPDIVIQKYLVSLVLGVLFLMVFSTVIRVRTRWVVYLGAISYSVYLMHPFFLAWIETRLNPAAGFDPLVFVLYVAATLAAASLCYYLIEAPCIRLGRVLKDRLASPRTVPTGA